MTIQLQQQKAILGLLSHPDLSDSVLAGKHQINLKSVRTAVRYRMAELCYVRHTPRDWRAGLASPLRLQEALSRKSVVIECQNLYRPALYHLVCATHRGYEAGVKQVDVDPLFWAEYRNACWTAVEQFIRNYDPVHRHKVLNALNEQEETLKAATLLALTHSKNGDSVRELQKDHVLDIGSLVDKYFLDQFAVLQFPAEQDETEVGSIKGKKSLLRLVFEGRCQDNKPFNVNNQLAKKLDNISRGDESYREKQIEVLWRELVREVTRETVPLVLKTHLEAYLSNIRRVEWAPEIQRFQASGDELTGWSITQSAAQKEDPAPTVYPKQGESWMVRVSSLEEQEYNIEVDKDIERVRQYALEVFYELPFETRTLLLMYHFDKYMRVIAEQNATFDRYAARLIEIRDQFDEPFLAAQFVKRESETANYFAADAGVFRRGKRDRAKNAFKNALREKITGPYESNSFTL